MAFPLRKQTCIICELCACTLDERELVNWTESTGNVNEGLQRHSRSLLSNSGSTFTTLSACLFVAEVSSTGAGVTFSGGGVDVPVSAIQKKRNFTVPNLFEKFSSFYIFIHSSHWLSTLNAPVNTCTILLEKTFTILFLQSYFLLAPAWWNRQLLREQLQDQVFDGCKNSASNLS